MCLYSSDSLNVKSTLLEQYALCFVPNLRGAEDEELRKQGRGSFDFRLKSQHLCCELVRHPSVTLPSASDGPHPVDTSTKSNIQVSSPYAVQCVDARREAESGLLPVLLQWPTVVLQHKRSSSRGNMIKDTPNTWMRVLTVGGRCLPVL